ncbi:MAG: hypothetical protein PVI71_05675 [Desulfobacterales bacterium]|jgi:hypothetical protein
MGKIEKQGDRNEFVFRQDDGEITTRFGDIQEKMVLAHEGSPTYKKVFYFLVLGGVLYLTFIFIFH